MKKFSNTKKSNLLMSICSMFLCVAILCFGVLAAESTTYNVSGNITYNMIDGIALINTRVYKVETMQDADTLQNAVTTLSTMTFESIERSTDPYYTLSQKLDAKATLKNTSSETSSTLSENSINISYGATDSSVWYYTYFIVINVTSLYDGGELSVTLTDNSEYTGVIKSLISSQSSISKNITKNIIIGLSLENTEISSLDFTIDYDLKVDYYKIGSFTYDEHDTVVSFNFKIGMTWTEYINSSYNDGKWRIENNSVERYVSEFGYWYSVTLDYWTHVGVNETIIDGQDYKKESGPW